MRPKLRKYLKKTKLLDFPSLLLAVALILSLWFENVKLGASVALVLIVLVCVRWTCGVSRKIRYLQVKNRNTDNLFNRIKKQLCGRP